MIPEFLRINWIGIQEGEKIRYENYGAGKVSPILYKTFLRQLREGLKHKKRGGDPEKNSNFN